MKTIEEEQEKEKSVEVKLVTRKRKKIPLNKPATSFVVSDSDSIDSDSEDSCKICYAEKMDTVVLDCGHRFCNTCAIEAKLKNSCHFCRKKVKKIQRIY